MLDVGAPAPDFTLKDQDGRPVTLRQHRDVTDVLLVFFPLAFTGICQRELDDIQTHCRTQLAGYKIPRQLVIAEAIRRSPSGKADYRWAREVAARADG